MADPRLPTDVLIEVLKRLPVKSLLRFRCVSKSWRDLICSSLFIHMHLKYDREQRVLLVKRYSLPENADVDDGIFPFRPLYTPVLNDLTIPSCSRTLFINMGLPSGNEEGEMFSFDDPDSPQVLNSPNLSIPSFNVLIMRSLPVPIHGPCNGLVCIALGKDVYLCNPALREFKLLPPRKFPENYAADPLGYGFWFETIGGVYKVIQIWEYPNEFPEYEDFLYDPWKNGIRVDLYDSASNSWKQIDAKVPDDINYLHGVELIFNGTIHWYALTGPNNDYHCILCFDTSSEAFRQLDFNDNVSPPGIELARLMELDDSLAMVWFYSEWTMMDQCDYVIDIWVMKEYGVKDSWTKQFVVKPYCIFRPLLFKKNELVFESDNGQLGVCTIHEKSLSKKFGFYGLRQSFSAVVYEESLISLSQIISSDRKNDRV